MRPMDHAEAHELLADLALEPSNVGTASTPDDNDLLSLHVATLRRLSRRSPCVAEHAPGDRGRTCDARWWPPTDGGSRRPSGRSRLQPPSGRRSRRSPGRRAASRRTPFRHPLRFAEAATRRRLSWRTAAPILAAVAVLVIAVAVAPRSGSESRRFSCARRTSFRRSTAVLGRLLSEPDHRVVSLAAADGTKEGSVAWSNHDLAVITTALKEPSAGEVYRCWIERDGVRSPVGKMWFVGRPRVLDRVARRLGDDLTR